MVDSCNINWQYIMKQLEYITKDHVHISMHIRLFTTGTASFFSVLVA